MLNRLDRYIIQKFLGTFIFMVLIMLSVSVVIDVAEKIDTLIEQKPPLDRLIFEYYFNFCLFFGNLLSPICIFLAVIFFTSRLTSNTEIVAMLSAGVSFWRIMATYLFTATLLAVSSFYLNAYIVPIATQNRIDFEYEYLKKETASRQSNIHKKIGFDGATGQETYMYLHLFNHLENAGDVFSMELMQGADIQKKIDADRIVWKDSSKTWRLEGVKIRTFQNRTEQVFALPFMDTTLLLTPDDIFIKEMRAESMPLNALSSSIELEKVRGSGLEQELVMELYKRYAYPFAAIILTLIGFSISTQKRRGGTPLQIGVGLTIAFVYVLLVVTGQAIIGNRLPSGLAIWLPNLVFMTVAMFLLRMAPK